MPERKQGSGAKGIQDILWKAANRLRGTMDAAQYKEFVLGLVFLKYISDAFAERRELLSGDDDRQRYAGVFWVPENARWDHLARNAGGDVGGLLDDAMDAIMRENPALDGVLPKIFGRGGVDPAPLRELVTLISDARFTGHADRAAQDVLGQVYEYFLEKFARAEGKRAGEFYTPASVVKLLVEVLEPFHGKVYDPCCGSGGMFVQAGRAHGRDITVYGQEANERTWRLAKMNLAIHGMDPGGLGDRWADTFAEDKQPGLAADFILANPPFNMSEWARRADDPRWVYGLPPRGNANFAWLQHMVAKLARGGRAGVVLSNGSMSSKLSGEGAIRRRIVEEDLVSCMVALPGNLFRSTAIPACVWFLGRDKQQRRGQILFVDARQLGTMVDRTERVLTDGDIARIADTYHAWRTSTAYTDVPGFCFSASLEQVAENDHILTPGRYVGAASAEADPDAEPVADRIARLTEELFAQFEESARLAAAVREQLGKLDV
ncbi:class I SAM-dependent DNA methyltransferase [Paractinoplanes ferrugineus]|uniref:site-specific DNA-methyltransferase (adenine-specific) n=1 Tax=Paractinoplanes ferrugineus TaxID=113564 RepID=A0A919IZN5_9ACTN|nr:class I SAM-dependent DNA methyltransferase [Actinoplanes ferrugineus]GIE10827.1 type I restriction endonuclease subunit M [Actinoplanes ferrugineus]